MTTDADARKIKKQLYSQPQRLKIFCGRGLREVLSAEVARILESAVEPHKFAPVIDPEGTDKGGALVVENLGFRNALELALRCSVAKEILLEVARGRADTAKNAQKVWRDVPWDLLLKNGEALAVRATSLKSRLFHEGALKESASKHLASLGYEIETRKDAGVIVDLRLVENELAVSISIPGAHLSHRGYKAALGTAAPFREDLAAAGVEAALVLAYRIHGARWRPGRIIAPFAGSGTLGFEATRGFLKLAPGLFRGDWPFLAAPCAPEKTVSHLLSALRDRVDARALTAPVLFIERDAEQCQNLRVNGTAFNARLVGQGVPAIAFDVEHNDVFSVDTKTWAGEPLFLASNPPYGIRLEDRSTAQKTYKKLGRWLADLGGQAPLTGYVVGREDDLELTAKSLARGFELEVIRFTNGGLKLGLLAFTTNTVLL